MWIIVNNWQKLTIYWHIVDICQKYMYFLKVIKANEQPFTA